MDFRKAILKVREANKILIVSHYDCDGLCSAKILKTTLKKEGKETKIKIVKEISKDIIREIEDEFEKENFDLIIFSDLGSPYLSLLPEDKDIIILDHHVPENIKVPKNIILINPYLENKELCGAGICYLFASKINQNPELIDYAIVGAIGDNQAEIGENKKIVSEAEKIKRLKIEKGLKIFGHVNRPLHESLKNANFFPLNTYSEVVQFLSDINLNQNGKIKSYYDLSKEEKEKLLLEIIKERIRNNLEEPANIFSDVYILTKQPRELMDALEFSTILNAFGRLERYDEAFELMDGKLEKLEEIMLEYRKKLATYLSFVAENMNSFPQTENILFINAKEKIDENMIGTVTSIVINSLTNKKIVLGFAYSGDMVKISARSKIERVDLNEIVSKICEKLGGTGGGHKEAAGGKIEKGKEEEFIEEFKKIVEK
ncbi:MAG: hypothetical protein DRP10_00965 [Candidatus Aenigmatarchaeota archaeon]|nr:MAG: hypothetical protein DRP10_00965 [Candidatus Aenigmarchaeota archaeon]